MKTRAITNKWYNNPDPTTFSRRLIQDYIFRPHPYNITYLGKWISVFLHIPILMGNDSQVLTRDYGSKRITFICLKIYVEINYQKMKFNIQGNNSFFSLLLKTFFMFPLLTKI